MLFRQGDRPPKPKEFDVLLVFMFDRLGRRDDETPFVVEWFVQNGIEVWSVVEGQQRFDNHVDKLLNYIRYWQASGESIKTSVRVKTRMEQMTEKGLYTGGTIPYGYRLEKRGRQNKKNQDAPTNMKPATTQAYIATTRTRTCRTARAIPKRTEETTRAIAEFRNRQEIPKLAVRALDVRRIIGKSTSNNGATRVVSVLRGTRRLVR